MKRLVSSRFNSLAQQFSVLYLESAKDPIHSGLGKTLLRLAMTTKDLTFFQLVSSKILPSLVCPGGELSGVFVHSLVCVQGYDKGMQYFLACDPTNSRFGIMLPEFLFSLYETKCFRECIQCYSAVCKQLSWEHLPQMDEQAYYKRQQPFKTMQHSRIYAAVIGSYLALNNKPLADALMEEMKFWKVQPLRETYYDYLDVNIVLGNEI